MVPTCFMDKSRGRERGREKNGEGAAVNGELDRSEIHIMQKQGRRRDDYASQEHKENSR